MKPISSKGPVKVAAPDMGEYAPTAPLEEEAPNVTSQEQKQYDTVVSKAMELIYGEDRLPTLVEKLKANTDNISGEIGHSAAMTLQTIDRTVKNQGQKIPGEIIFSAGQEIVSQLTDVAVAAGIIKEEIAQKVAEAAMYEGTRIWGKSMGERGEIDDAKQGEAQALLKQAGIEQDTSAVQAKQALPAGGMAMDAAANPGAPPTTMPPGAAGPPAGAPPPGIVNQAMGVQ